MTTIKRIQTALLLATAGLPIAASAQIANPGTETVPVVNGAPGPAFTSFQEVINTVNKFLGWLFTALIVLSGVFIILAAFYYLTAGGEEEKIKKAKDRLIYAVVAIAIGLVATSVKYIVGALILNKAP